MYKFGDEYKNFISYDSETKEYTVWDETQAYTIGTTCYPKVAEAMLQAYCTYYLNYMEGEQ